MRRNYLLSLFAICLLSASCSNDVHVVPICGNDEVEDGEICDGEAISKTCADLGEGYYGTIKCREDCMGYDESGCVPPVIISKNCGNNQIDANEVCDGTALNKTCADLGKDYTGTMKCKADCSGYDESGCVPPQSKCGNNELDDGEVCDGTATDKKCEDLGEGYTGTIKCKADCSGYDESGCVPLQPVCGNNKTEEGEVCDGTDLGKKCEDLGKDYTGTMKCKDDCSGYDETGCVPPGIPGTCGNNKIDKDEVCDGTAMDKKCEDLGEGYSGTMKCKDDCLGYDETGCVPPKAKCGNNKTEKGEVCDGTDLGKKCEDLGKDYTGTMKCKDDCSGYDETGCVPPGIPGTCGNDKIDKDEVCDGKDINKKCEDLGEGYTGTMKCKKDCLGYDDTGCVPPKAKCGNDKTEKGEVCDGTDLGKKCEDLGKDYTGTMKCKDDCSGYDESGCVPPGIAGTCGNDKLDKDEVCDGTAMNGHNCASLGRGYTGISKCKKDCLGFDDTGCEPPEMPKTCGNDQLDEGELCDGEHFDEELKYDCKSIFGPGSTGELKCDSSCLHFDKSACTPPPTCGDGKVQINEKCDPKYNNEANELCSAYFSQGTEGKRKCDEMCRWDTSECIAPDHCGNGQVDKDLGEDCDPSSPQSYELTCEAVFGPGSVGTITCSNLCKYESSWCTVTTACGNDKVDNGQNGNPNYSEVCDPGDLKGKKCTSLGTDYSGTLKCLSNCSGFDFSDCEILPQY